MPASYHNGAAGFSFADGHPEVKRWMVSSTKQLHHPTWPVPAGTDKRVNYAGVRDTATNRTIFSLALAQVLDSFFSNYYRLGLRTGAAP